MKQLPLWMLIVGAARHYLWPLFPVAWQADVWNITGACAVLLALAFVTVVAVAWLNAPVGITLAIAAWFAAEEVLVIGCALAYLIDPQISFPGGERCSAHTGMKLGVFGLFILSLLLLALKPATVTSTKPPTES